MPSTFVSRQAADEPTNTDDLPHNDLGPVLNAVFWTLTSLAFVFMALRLYCKYHRGRHFWWDDYVLIASWIALAVSASTTTVCVALDYGKHGYDINPDNLPKMPFVAVFAGFFSVLAAAWSKTSFALTLIRLSERWMRIMIWFIVVTVNGILGTAMLFMWVKCRPIAKIWDVTLEGECIPGEKIITLFQWSAGWSGAMDVVLALCPWVLLWNMKMLKREKIGVAVAMSMGVVAGVASLVKMVELPHLAGDPADTVRVTIWGGAEGSLTIIAASIPVLRMLIRRKPPFAPAELSPTDISRLRAPMSFPASNETNESQLSPSSGHMLLGSPSYRAYSDKD
ncbi:hypothetical protein OQA88_5113 [Cercophora sp. LCS_1]